MKIIGRSKAFSQRLGFLKSCVEKIAGSFHIALGNAL